MCVARSEDCKIPPNIICLSDTSYARDLQAQGACALRFFFKIFKVRIPLLYIQLYISIYMYYAVIISDRIQNTEEWMWYEKYIVNYLLNQLRLSDRFTSADVQRAVGLLNVNAVALKYPMNSTRKEAVHF